MKVIVCGGRHYSQRTRLNKFLDDFHIETPITILIHGDANGADKLAGLWGFRNGITVDPTPADWGKYGWAGGPIRNAEMIDKNPDVVIAFPGGRGTGNMVYQAQRKYIRVVHVEDVSLST